MTIREYQRNRLNELRDKQENEQLTFAEEVELNKIYAELMELAMSGYGRND